MQEKYNNLQDYLDFEFTGVKSFFGYEFRTRKACVLASSTMYMPSKDLCDKYKLRNPNPNAGAIHKESREHYIGGRLNPMITVQKIKVAYNFNSKQLIYNYYLD